MSVFNKDSGGLRWVLLIILSFLISASGVIAQDLREEAPELKKADKAAIIDSVLTGFEVHYVYPDKAKMLSKYIRGKFAAGDYGEIDDRTAFARQLGDDMRSFTKDRHIHVSVMSPDDPPALGDTLTDEQIFESGRTNYGFRKVEWLTGNVGYVRIDRFEYAIFAGEVASAAMNFLARCDAVIIDLRNNGGGDETMVRFLGSYFFKNPTQINALYFTETDSLEQSWTSAFVPGRKLIDADLYILTSNRTASGAEAFSYGMKHAGRATIIGKNTSGAAHWTEYWDYPTIQIRASIPIARPINPVTKTSWEGTGVTPDIDIADEKALAVAHREALKKIIERTTDEQRKKDLEWDMVAVESQIESVNLSREDMETYTGEYNDGRNAILIKDDALFWRNFNGTEYIMIPLTRDLFGFDDTDNYRIGIVRDESGGVIGHRILAKGGEMGPIKKRIGDN